MLKRRKWMDAPLIKKDDNVLNMGLDRLEALKGIAAYFAESDLVPAHFQGKPANVFIALQYAARLDLDPFLTMQSLYIVHGRPGWEGKFLIGLVNRSNLFNGPLEFEWQGEKGQKNWGCRAVAKKGRKTIYGPWVTWEMVSEEGWNENKPIYDKQTRKPIPGKFVKSKWNTMPEMMFTYRAGAYFVNTICPQVKLGIPTREELEDTSFDLQGIPGSDVLYVDQTETFWKLVSETSGGAIQGKGDDPAFDEFLVETCHAIGYEAHEILYEQAVADFQDFWAAWERFRAKQTPAEPETAQMTPPEPQEGAENEEPVQTPAPDAPESEAPAQKATNAQLALIEGYLKKKDVAMNTIPHLSDTAMNDLTFDQAEEALVYLKNLK